MLKTQKNNLLPIFILLISAVIIAGLFTVFQGGTLTQTIINKEAGYTVSAAIKIQFRTNPGITFWGGDASTEYTDFMPLNNPGIFFFLLMQLGPLPLIFPLVCYILYKNIADKNNVFIFKIMFLAAILSFFIPIFIKYPISDVNFTRILAIFKHIGNIFLGSVIGIMVIKKIPYRKYIIPTGFIILVSYLAAPIIYNLFAITRQFSEDYQWGFNKPPHYITPQDILIAEEAKKNVPINSRILTGNIIIIPTLWGRFVPFGEGRKDPWKYSATFTNLFPAPSLENLKKLKISYIYIAPHHDLIKDGFLLNGIDQKYLQDNPGWFSLIKKWEFNNQSYYIYKVLE